MSRTTGVYIIMCPVCDKQMLITNSGKNKINFMPAIFADARA